ncbi:uncharacterized protein LOC128634211 isoform X1 [Ictalurus punctatus]|uniref:Uncharacterized protein LOC128634211 isoform X1 n=1 Tax=Ictalurus punctatus TaxID=7998 RepID=A0A9F7RHT9_ICTPU|nr:uncharacterized protein LOC128634211 isoform X1 [Ictalurus punctatus]
MDRTLQYLLEASLQQHAVTQQLAESLQVAIQTLIAMRTEAPAASVPLPDASSEIRRLLPPLGPEEDLEAYFEAFESIARREGWDREDWPRALGPLLTGEARTAYYALEPEEAADYLAMKEGVLAWCGRTPGQAATEFHRWVYRPGARPRCQMSALIRITKRWLRPDRHTASEVAEKVAVDRFLRALPRAERQAVGAHATTTPQELLTVLERTLATLELDPGEQQHLDRPLGAQGPRSDRQTRPCTWRNPQRAPTWEHPRDESMPTEPEREAAWLPTKPWLAGCALHQRQPPEVPSLTVWVEGKPVTALLDTGSAVTLAQPSILPDGHRPSGTLTMTCVHGDTREVPAAEVQIRGDAGTWPLQVGIIPKLPVPLLLGRDWPGFRVVPRAGPRRSRRRVKGQARIDRVGPIVREAGLTANPKKCHPGLTEAQYLGYRIGRGMLKPQLKKIEAVKDYPRPTSKNQVRAFLGLAGYYRRFVPNFSAVASPLSDLTKKGQPDQVRWTADAERAFQALKEALTDTLWAHHRAAVGSELRGGYCRDRQSAGAHKKEIAPSPTAAPARRGQPPAEHSASRKDRRGRAGLTRLRPAIGGSNGEVPPLRRRRRRIKGRASGWEGEENIVASRRTPRHKRGRDRRIVRVAHTEDAGPGKPPPRLGNPASATSRLRRPPRLHKTPRLSTYNPFTSP